MTALPGQLRVVPVEVEAAWSFTAVATCAHPITGYARRQTPGDVQRSRGA